VGRSSVADALDVIYQDGTELEEIRLATAAWLECTEANERQALRKRETTPRCMNAHEARLLYAFGKTGRYTCEELAKVFGLKSRRGADMVINRETWSEATRSMADARSEE